MTQNETELFAEIAKTAEAGQLVYSGPATLPDEAVRREMYDRGWEDVSLFGMPTGMYQGSMLGLSIAVMCADVKARDMSKSEIALWKRMGRGWTPVEAAQNALARLFLERPNDTEMSWPEFIRMVVLHLGLTDNAYIFKDIADDGTILGLYPVMPTRCRMVVSASDRIYYEVMAGTQFERAVFKTDYFVVPADRMIHLRGRMFDGINGLSSMVVGDPVFALMNAIGQFQTKLFQNDGKQPLVFETEQQFADDAKSNAAFKRLKEQLTERTAKATTTGAPILLEAGLTAKSIASNAKDNVTAESFNQTVMRICGLMQTPPHKIFALDSVAYNNMTGMDRQYANDCLLPIAVNIEQKFRNALLPRRLWATMTPQFDRAQLMANDPETLSKLLDLGMRNGGMTINEFRENLPFRLNPLAEGGEDRTVPVNMALVKPDGTVRMAAEGQNPTQPGADGQPSADNNADKGIRLVANNGAA